jgi:hypothetical protein
VIVSHMFCIDRKVDVVLYEKCNKLMEFGYLTDMAIVRYLLFLRGRVLKMFASFNL